ncbi:hypothetical protein GDO81_006854 [Engystomops pustulosus]|uniref:Uncharacterized protein n=1 Tax=Engystomops pustulosus TaxID=76066 RepID=A0AAV7CZW8_ENGPU|nr:hypothetical protein GDO81_006854 [Engystomops pustulosus]
MYRSACGSRINRPLILHSHNTMWPCPNPDPHYKLSRSFRDASVPCTMRCEDGFVKLIKSTLSSLPYHDIKTKI